ncbi:MAG: hypothetical protein MK105_02045 [Crocinitomicaceae bacterium]|nr:hypothetical protein [Crocinitomicaceae bacterium]
MGIIKKEGGAHVVFEIEQEGILVAIEKQNTSAIKKYWKKYKGKSEQPEDTVQGFPFVHDEVQNSLKIDFTNECSYPIKSLKKFD